MFALKLFARSLIIVLIKTMSLKREERRDNYCCVIKQYNELFCVSFRFKNLCSLKIVLSSF